VVVGATVVGGVILVVGGGAALTVVLVAGVVVDVVLGTGVVVVGSSGSAGMEVVGSVTGRSVVPGAVVRGGEAVVEDDDGGPTARSTGVLPHATPPSTNAVTIAALPANPRPTPACPMRLKP